MRIGKNYFLPIRAALFIFGAVSVCGIALSEDAKLQNQPSSDNSKINQRDSLQPEVTATDQGSSAADTEITRKIRRSITSDSKLSTYAHNVKIITINGMVTLKGPVKSVEEKQKVYSMAQSIAGEAKVKNEIDLAK